MESFTVVSTEHDIDLYGAEVELVVAATGLVWRQFDPHAAYLEGPKARVTVDGAIVSSVDAVVIGGYVPDASRSLTVGGSGVIVCAGTALLFQGGGVIDNAGLIRGHTAISVRTEDRPDQDDTDLAITNTGQISALETGLNFRGSTGQVSFINSGLAEAGNEVYVGSLGRDTVTNSGLLRGAVSLNDGWDLFLQTAEGRLEGNLDAGALDDEVWNDGTIAGSAQLGSGHDIYRSEGGRIEGDLLTGDGFDQVFNAGTITGDVRLGADNDIFVGLGGLVEGTVFGEDGFDTFIAGAGIERFDGGEGFDTLDFSEGPGLRVSLADGSSTGAAAGDVYASIERVVGSNSGADVLIGDDAANELDGRGGKDALGGGGGNDTLLGGLGADRLLGDAGNDRLVGEGGRDRLTGGAGDDAFVFLFLSDRGDRISDFGAVLGNDDRIEVRGEAFGGGLVAGALAASQFRAGADNRAMDADDRFILRTSDKTLWFDADGRGGQGPVLLADLQDNARFTAEDILIV